MTLMDVRRKAWEYKSKTNVYPERINLHPMDLRDLVNEASHGEFMPLVHLSPDSFREGSGYLCGMEIIQTPSLEVGTVQFG